MACKFCLGCLYLYSTVSNGRVGQQNKHLRHTSKTEAWLGRKGGGVWAGLPCSTANSDKSCLLPAHKRLINLRDWTPICLPPRHPAGLQEDWQSLCRLSVALNCHIQSPGLTCRRCHAEVSRQLAPQENADMCGSTQYAKPGKHTQHPKSQSVVSYLNYLSLQRADSKPL